jgi:hypothetical protein
MRQGTLGAIIPTRKTSARVGSGRKEKRSMAMEDERGAVGLIMTFPGVTEAQYYAVLEQLDLGGRLPHGGISHAAGPIEGGWRVVDVWESEETFETFFREKLEQAMQNAGVPTPDVETWQVYSTLESASTPAGREEEDRGLLDKAKDGLFGGEEEGPRRREQREEGGIRRREPPRGSREDEPLRGR